MVHRQGMPKAESNDAAGEERGGVGLGPSVMVRMLQLRDDIPRAETRAKRDFNRNKGVFGVTKRSA